MKNLIIFFCLLILFFLSIFYINILSNTYTNVKKNNFEIVMSDCNVYFFENHMNIKNNLLFNFSSDTCKFFRSFRNIDAYGNIKGNIHLSNENIKFSCSKISMASFDNKITYNDLIAKLNDNSNIKSEFGLLDMNNMFIKSDKLIEFNTKDGKVKANNCYADLINKVLKLNNVELLFILDDKKI